MKRTELRRKTELKRTGKLRTRRKGKERNGHDAKGRREYVNGDGTEETAVCEYGIFAGCKNAPQDPEHFLGRGVFMTDDPRGLVRLCRSCHDSIGRGHAAAINGLYIKIFHIRVAASIDGTEKAVAAYVAFLETLGFRVGRIRAWLEEEPQKLAPEVLARGWLVLAWCGIGQD